MSKPDPESPHRYGALVFLLGATLAALGVGVAALVQVPWWSTANKVDPRGMFLAVCFASVGVLRFWWISSDGRWPAATPMARALLAAFLVFAPAGVLVMLPGFYREVFWLPGQPEDQFPVNLWWDALAVWVHLALVFAAFFDIAALSIFGTQFVVAVVSRGLEITRVPERYYSRTLLGRKARAREKSKQPWQPKE
jgi:hypothetical protein